ncbi:MAG: hypothetical protein IH599_07040, partial [Bacteroidales bacterium]|nr:hypothetical protein [Bacteroidales bacterium]
RKAEVDLSSYISADRVRFRVVRGGTNADVALDDIFIRQVPAQEAELLAITSPQDGCELGYESVVVQLVNRGSAVTAANMSLSYQANGGVVVTEVVPSPIPVGDTLSYTFNTLLNMTVLQDSLFGISAWVSLSGDPDPGNDTAKVDVLSGLSPAQPSAGNAVVSPLAYAERR